MRSLTIAGLAAALVLPPGGAVHADDIGSTVTCASTMAVSPIVTQPTAVAGALAAGGVFVAPDPAATSTTYECWIGPVNYEETPWSPRFLYVAATAAGNAVPVASADASLGNTTDGPFFHCERAHWESPSGGGVWWRDYDPDTPGIQCSEYETI